MRKALAYFLAAWTASLPAAAQQLNRIDGYKTYDGNGPFAWIKRSYLPRYSPQVDFSNSNRLESLMRAGRIYLSLRDAIALAIENNLDIEYARFGPKQAETDQLRAASGSLLSGINTNVRGGASSASVGVLAGSTLLGSTGATTSTGGQGGVLSGFSIQGAGTNIPNLDPVLFANGNMSHGTRPLTSSFTTGTNYLVTRSNSLQYGYSQGFLTGTQVQFGWDNQSVRQNSPLNDFNPSTNGSIGLYINQHLLQGFGLAVNNRAIRIARNNRTVSDLVFKEQVMATVKNVVDLYWDLVTFNDNLKVKQQALELNQRLYSDNKKKVAIGAIAPIEIVQAEAEVAASQQEVTNAETQVLQQEMIVKNVLTRSGIDSLALAEARIVPTDTFHMSDTEEVRPVQDLVAEALANRPEFEQNRLAIANSRINIQGTRSAMLPTLDVWVSAQNNALAGQINTVPFPEGSPQANLLRQTGSVNGFFLGGYGTVLSQLFARNFPDYAVGFQLNIPLRNRRTQADMIKAQLDLRQQQINDKQFQNSVRLNVLNARIALQQARAAYDTSIKARKLQEQTLNGERRKYQLGTSNFLNVVIVQRDLVNRQSAEVQALNNYMHAKSSLDMVVGRVLKVNEVEMDEAYAGTVKRPADLPPAISSGVSQGTGVVSAVK